MLPPTHVALSAQGQSVVEEWALIAMRSLKVRIHSFSVLPKEYCSPVLVYTTFYSHFICRQVHGSVVRFSACNNVNYMYM